MFFSGDPSARKRVDLGGRSSKERDRQKLLEQTRLERNRRMFQRKQNSAAIKIQKCYRGWKAVEAERHKVREQFFATYGKRCQNVSRNCFGPDSRFLGELLFFLNPRNADDLTALAETGRLLQHFAQDTGGLVTLFAGMDYSTNHCLVSYRVKQLTYACIRAVHANRSQLKKQSFLSESNSHILSVFLEATVLLIDPKLPWACGIISYLLQRNAFTLLREITLAVKESLNPQNMIQNMIKVSSLEQVLILIMSHVGEKPCLCQNADQRWIFSSQILTIPFLWQMFPCLKEVFARQQLFKHYVHRMSLSVQSHINSLAKDVSAEYPSYACLLGNILEAATLAISETDSSFEMMIAEGMRRVFRSARAHSSRDASHIISSFTCSSSGEIKLTCGSLHYSIANTLRFLHSISRNEEEELDTVYFAVDFVSVATFLLDMLPPLKSVSKETNESSSMEDDEMMDAEEYNGNVLCENLESQISNAIDPRFLLQLIKVLLGGVPPFTSGNCPDDKEVVAVGAACAFLHVTFNTLPLERIMTILAYRTSLVPVLWSFMKRCHETQKWSLVAEQSSYLPEGVPGWLLPLAVFCPVYKHMLMIVDNEEFYEKEKPLALKDIRYLIVILRQALWELLWLNPVAPSNFVKSKSKSLAYKKQPLEFLQYRVSIVVAELLTQLQDWNNRRQFAPSSDFHADGVNEFFISQAMQENTRAREIVKQAPFLVPFTSRVKIFASLLSEARKVDNARAVFSRNRLKIRRDQILEDAFSQLSTLSEDDLRERIRVTFINELGVEEAGVDGGGIFKDFMENVTRAAFDIQYGLFKETADHLLYPNPGSGLVHEQHLQFFRFLGTILAKAMFEGILVDIPFATFFLSKLKQKHNYLNDLPSLDPELYRHLIFLKHYQGDVSDLELYFVIVNNEYGEQTEEELLPGGKNTRVTNDNVIPFIHLIANHRLNYQIRQQSSHFLRGFQQLIQKEWIDMFNEHELQILISGSLDGLDIDDLRSHTQYSGGYHAEHYVIEMFWEVLKGFTQDNQRKFLKFVTGCSRGPLLGFKSLEPQFCIQRAAGDASEESLDRLPTSATCMNLLKLPPYRSKEQLERKLLYAISSEAGFDLS